MKIFTRDYKTEHFNSPLWGEYFNGLKPCVLDIEATGLDPKRCKLILVGLLTETESGLRVNQFLAENHYEEHQVINATLEFLKNEGINYIITYNGQRYDVPFIKARLDACHLEEELNIYNFDLYKFLRKHSTLSDTLGSLSQSSVEKYFCIASDRQDTISGRENVALYEQYALNGNSTIEKIILTHNREDVLQLYTLMKLAGKDDFHDILKCKDFHTAIAGYGFPVCNANFSVRASIVNPKKVLRITGDQITAPFSAAYFPNIDTPITANFSAKTSSFEIEFPIETHNNDYYVNIKKLGIELQSNSELIGDNLILTSKSINILAAKILNKFI